MRIFLSAYTVRVDKKRNNKKQKPTYCKLSAFNDCIDIYDGILTLLKTLENNTKNDTYKTYMKATLVKPDGRSISGVIENGVYGISNNLRDVETNSITYKKMKSDADVLPFYFLIYLPKDTDEGILLLQRTGTYGIRKNFGHFLQTHFSKKYSKFSVEINPLVQLGLIKKVLDRGTIKKLRCIKYDAPVDSFDGFDRGHKEVPFDMEIVLSASKIPFMDGIKKIFDPNCDIKKLVEIREFEFDYDTVKLEVDIDGSIRIFDLGELQRTRTNYDISGQIVMDADEQPTFTSIHQVAKSYLEEIIKEVYP